ncbi:MAG: hypothetical protein ABI432_07050 [Flavobacteriales bacterium]
MRMPKTGCLVILTMVILAGCKRETEDNPCVNVVPEIGLYNGSVGYDEAVVDSVPRSAIPLSIGCSAGLGYFDDPRLNDVEIRLIVSATDSVFFAVDAQPDAFAYSFAQTVVMDPITEPMPALLRITVANNCGHSTNMLRQLVVMPD